MDSSIWNLRDSDAFTGALLSHLEVQRATGRASRLASALLDVLDLDARIAMDGFADIFYQMLSAERCRAVIATLNAMGLTTLGALFEEAFSIYSRGNSDISDADFALLDPFSLDAAPGARFDEIAALFAAPESELWRICEATHAFAMQRRGELE